MKIFLKETPFVSAAGVDKYTTFDTHTHTHTPVFRSNVPLTAEQHFRVLEVQKICALNG